jgi:hypothetical protein
VTSEEIRQTIAEFLALLKSETSNDERERKLAFVLDKLALAYHFIEYDFDEKNYPDAPREDYAKLYALVGNKFPNFGLYNQAHRISKDIGINENNSIGDAIDDIVDIATDLSEVIYCWENNSVDNALWQFKFSFESHWENHLRGLQLYLCALKIDS